MGLGVSEEGERVRRTMGKGMEVKVDVVDVVEGFFLGGGGGAYMFCSYGDNMCLGKKGYYYYYY